MKDTCQKQKASESKIENRHEVHCSRTRQSQSSKTVRKAFFEARETAGQTVGGTGFNY